MYSSSLNFRFVGMVLALAVLFMSWQGPVKGQTAEMDKKVVNGLNVTQLEGLINTLKENPDKGNVTFYSHSRWQDGMRSFTSFTGYKVDGNMVHEKKRKFVLLGDESVELGGTDAAPGAVEELMYALGTCIIAAGNANAALRGVELSKFEVELESDVDLHGLFDLEPEVRPGILELRANITIAGDADKKTLKKIANLGYQFSPVSESIRNKVDVKPEVEVVSSE